MKIKYWVIVVLIIVNIIMFLDALDSFRYAPLGMWLIWAIDVPLGIALLVISSLVKKKELEKTNLRNLIINTGVVVGIIFPLLSIILFLLKE